MSDIGWCNHITVTHGVCGLCGQYVGSSEQDAARDNEIAALRERAEKAEHAYRSTLEEKRVQQERAEKADREKAEAVAFRQQAQDTTVEALRQRDAIQADLDAALDFTLWLRDVTRSKPANLDAEREDPEPYPGEHVEDRVLSLLEARKEAKRGE